MNLEAPRPRKRLPLIAWAALFVGGGAALCFAAGGHFMACFATGGVAAAIALVTLLRTEIGSGWNGWSVEQLVEQLLTAIAITVAVTADRITMSALPCPADATFALARRGCAARMRRVATRLASRFHGLNHACLIDARLTSMRATTTAIR